MTTAPGGATAEGPGSAVDAQMAALARRAEQIVPEADLRAKLERSARTGTPMRIKFGMDPTAPDVTLGHAVPLYVGSRALPRHVVLVVGGDDAALTAYDPATGGRTTLTRAAFVRGDLRISGWSEPWFSVVPAGREAD